MDDIPNTALPFMTLFKPSGSWETGDISSFCEKKDKTAPYCPFVNLSAHLLWANLHFEAVRGLSERCSCVADMLSNISLVAEKKGDQTAAIVRKTAVQCSIELATEAEINPAVANVICMIVPERLASQSEVASVTKATKDFIASAVRVFPDSEKVAAAIARLEDKSFLANTNATLKLIAERIDQELHIQQTEAVSRTHYLQIWRDHLSAKEFAGVKWPAGAYGQLTAKIRKMAENSRIWETQQLDAIGAPRNAGVEV